MPRFFTQYWKNTTWELNKANESLEHSASNVFKSRGVTLGDKIFMVTVIDGHLYLGNVLRVDRMMGQRQAERHFGKPVWEAKDHVLTFDPKPFYTNLAVPNEIVKKMRFVDGKSPVFKTRDRLDQQTLRGLRELTADSASLLEQLVEGIKKRPKDEYENSPDDTSQEYLSISSHPYAKELQEEQVILTDPNIADTDKEQLIRARRGHGVYRDNLLKVEPRCRVTGVDDYRCLTASHIKPWSLCSNAERLSPNNGLMLAPHIDRLFDRGFISFTDFGDLLVSPQCPMAALTAWGISPTMNVCPFRDSQRRFLEYHREKVFKSKKPDS